jgi:hypothetical protein
MEEQLVHLSPSRSGEGCDGREKSAQCGSIAMDHKSMDDGTALPIRHRQRPRRELPSRPMSQRITSTRQQVAFLCKPEAS